MEKYKAYFSFFDIELKTNTPHIYHIDTFSINDKLVRPLLISENHILVWYAKRNMWQRFNIKSISNLVDIINVSMEIGYIYLTNDEIKEKTKIESYFKLRTI